MEVILCEDVPNVGKTGQVIKVKDGYTRNFLIPNKKAYLATPDNLKRIARLEEKRRSEYEAQKNKAQSLADELSKVSCTVAVEVNDLEKMYGSVTDHEIAKALESEGHVVNRKDIILEQPISELGIFDVEIKVHPEVSAKVRVWVTKK